MSDEKKSATTEQGEYVSCLHHNEKKIDALMKKVGLTLPTYLELTGGFPGEPLALPPKFMDSTIWIEITKKLCDEIDAAREWHDADAINQALKNRWNHDRCREIQEPARCAS